MLDYRKLYHNLFNAITDAVIAIDKQNFGDSRKVLIEAQRRCEELFLSEEEEAMITCEEFHPHLVFRSEENL